MTGLNFTPEELEERNFQPVKKLFTVADRYKPSNEYFPSTIHEIDEAIDRGFRDGELIVISGQTGNGKTLFAQSLTCFFGLLSIPCLWFTYEMSPFYLKQKFMAMGQTSDNLIYAPITLESGMKFISDMIDKAKEEYACKIVFIDHLHYLVPLSGGGNVSFAVGGVVRQLKLIAEKKGVIIFLLAHTKKVSPTESLGLDSVRDSSLVCQEADYVFLIQRQKENPELAQYDDGQEHATHNLYTNKTRVELAKNRRTGQVFYMLFRYENGILVPNFENVRRTAPPLTQSGCRPVSGEN
jgi:hypothetical protein